MKAGYSASRCWLAPVIAGIAAITLTSSSMVHARGVMNAVDGTKKDTENKVRLLLEPLFDKYCREECKLMSVAVSIDVATPDEIAPGFNDLDPRGAIELAPSGASVKILIDDKVGSVSRTKLLELVRQYLDTLDFPVKIETQTTHFPQPTATAGKVVELRERVTKRFKDSLEELFRQFCPDQCMLADYTLSTELVNAEEAQYGSGGEFLEDGGIAIRIKTVTGTVLIDESLPTDIRTNVFEMAKLKTNFLRNVDLSLKSMKFPKNALDAAMSAYKEANRSLASSSSSDSKNTTSLNQRNTESKVTTNSNSENNAKQERYERIEKIERVESGDAVQAELQKFKVYGLIFACSILSLLIFIAMASLKPAKMAGAPSAMQRVLSSIASDPTSTSAPSTYGGSGGDTNLTSDERAALIQKRIEIERMHEELTNIFAQQPKVAKHVFTRVLTEDGMEVTAQYISLFGESIVMDMLRDPSLQGDLNELMEFYAKNPIDLTDDEKLELLRKLHNRTVAGKLAVMGSRSSHLFDFLADMDGTQILELVRNESLTVKSIVLTQCDAQKRAAVYAQLDNDSRMQLMAELSRIDYLPRDYIFNVANALKRKRRENPKLNTESLPGSEVLITLLERTGADMQRTVIKNLELSNPDSARAVKSKLVSLDTLRFLRDGQLLEVVLSLRHDELLQFLKGSPTEIRQTIYSKSPKDLVAELEEELAAMTVQSRETYQAVERKIINRMKVMTNESLINLVEVNDRMLSEQSGGAGFVEAGPAEGINGDGKTITNIKKVAGW